MTALRKSFERRGVIVASVPRALHRQLRLKNGENKKRNECQFASLGVPLKFTMAWKRSPRP
jgi:hypothetical protein